MLFVFVKVLTIEGPFFPLGHERAFFRNDCSGGRAVEKQIKKNLECWIVKSVTIVIKILA